MEIAEDRPKVTGPQWLRAAARVLNKAVMGFLALGALALAVVPVLFAVPELIERAFDVAE